MAALLLTSALIHMPIDTPLVGGHLIAYERIAYERFRAGCRYPPRSRPPLRFRVRSRPIGTPL